MRSQFITLPQIGTGVTIRAKRCCSTAVRLPAESPAIPSSPWLNLWGDTINTHTNFTMRQEQREKERQRKERKEGKRKGREIKKGRKRKRVYDRTERASRLIHG